MKATLSYTSRYIELECDCRSILIDRAEALQLLAELPGLIAQLPVEVKENACPQPCSAPLVAQPPRDVSELYHELLYAVARKFPGESRHETALRYIRDTEERVCEAGSCKQNIPPRVRLER